VRNEVDSSRVAEAWGLLGRPVLVDGAVRAGRQLGRTLGFPTINLDVENELLPGQGVYVTAVHLPRTGRTLGSVTNVGVRPTVDRSSACSVESHIFGFSEEIYDEPVRLFFLERLRSERAFAGPEELRAQIARDAAQARAWLDRHPLEQIDLVLSPR
jgi:riboflavin kinase/FMN adenylyltransferase